MALIFVLYTAAFLLVVLRKRTLAIVFLFAAITSSIGMYLYHATSDLGLNF